MAIKLFNEQFPEPTEVEEESKQKDDRPLPELLPVEKDKCYEPKYVLSAKADVIDHA